MPYYKYELRTEEQHSKSNISNLEKHEHENFESILNKSENSLQVLVDIFAPPRFFVLFQGKSLSYPTLSESFRDKLIRKIQIGMANGKLKYENQLNLTKTQIKSCFESMLKEIPINRPLHSKFKMPQHSLVTVDPNNISNPSISVPSAISDQDSVLSLMIDTNSFINFLIDEQIFPLELLNYSCFESIYLKYNSEKIIYMQKKMLNDEGWDLIDAVSMLSGFYLPRNLLEAACRENYSLEVIKPLRHNPIEELSTNRNYVRTKGVIDSGEYPEFYKKLWQKFRNVFEQVKRALYLGRLTPTIPQKNEEILQQVLDEKMFITWALENQYEIDNEITQKYGIKNPNQMTARRIEDIKVILNKLEQEILKRAEKFGLKISLNQLCCPKKDFRKVMGKFDRAFCKDDETLNDYLKKHSQLKFKPGRRKDETLLPKLFPEYYS